MNLTVACLFEMRHRTDPKSRSSNLRCRIPQLSEVPSTCLCQARPVRHRSQGCGDPSPDRPAAGPSILPTAPRHKNGADATKTPRRPLSGAGALGQCRSAIRQTGRALVAREIWCQCGLNPQRGSLWVRSCTKRPSQFTAALVREGVIKTRFTTLIS